MNTKFNVGQRVTYTVRHEAKIDSIQIGKDGKTSYSVGGRMMGETEIAEVSAPANLTAPEFKPGMVVEIIGKSKHHYFNIGEKVRLSECFIDAVGPYWRAEYLDGHDYWHVRESDIKPVDDGAAASDKPVEPVKLYCVESYKPGEWLTKGKVYDFSDGGIQNYDDGWKSPRYISLEAFLNRQDNLSSRLVPLVKRPAKVGEWVYIVDASPDISNDYSNGSVLKIVSIGGNITRRTRYKAGAGKFLYDYEYLVLDGYHGEAES